MHGTLRTCTYTTCNYILGLLIKKSSVLKKKSNFAKKKQKTPYILNSFPPCTCTQHTHTHTLTLTHTHTHRDILGERWPHSERGMRERDGPVQGKLRLPSYGTQLDHCGWHIEAVRPRYRVVCQRRCNCEDIASESDLQAEVLCGGDNW